MSDLRYAVRTLTRSPGFASVAILSLALGIGANTAIYSVIRTVLLDPLPVPAPAELFAAGWNSRGVPMRGILQLNSTAHRDERRGVSYSSNFSYSLYRAFRQAGGPAVFGFSYAASDVRMSFAGQPVVASGLLVSGNFLSTLGVPVALGRPIMELDDRSDAAPVAMLTYGFWRRTLGGDPGVVGRTIQLNGSPFTIVGITAPGFYGMSRGGPFFKPTDVLLPLAVEPLVYTRSTARSLFGQDDRWWLQVMARVEPGAAATRLEATLDTVFRSTLAAASVPALRLASSGELRMLPAPRGLDSWTRALREPLVILGTVVGIVLLIASVNVGNLLLVRASARQKELSIRLALGSSRWQLVRGILVEGLVLAAAGGVLGVLVGIWGGRALLVTMIAGPRSALDIAIDGQLLAAAGIASAVAAVLFSAVPALRTARGRIAPILKQVAAGGGVPRFNAGRILMAAQVAISLPLLVGAALFLRTIHNLAAVDLGFTPGRLLLVQVDPSLNGYDLNRVERLYDQLLQRLAAIPGIDSATVTDIVLLSGLQNNWTFAVPGAEPKNVKFARVGPAYFETFGIPVVAGRTIGVQDHGGAPRVAVVNEAAARTLFGSGAAAMGRTLTMQSDQPAVFEIVGIVKDSRYTSPRDPMPPTVYLPYAQTTLGRLGPMTVAVRSTVALPALTEAVKAAFADVDRDIPITNLRTQMAQLDETLRTERTFMRLLLAFGFFALFLATIGLHGITAYSVVRRTSEIGVRVALGARERDVLWLILRQVVGITIAGIAIGIPAALATARLVRTSLFGIGPADPVSVAAAALVMLTVAVAAGFFPARRAARLDPLVALRCE